MGEKLPKALLCEVNLPKSKKKWYSEPTSAIRSLLIRTRRNWPKERKKMGPRAGFEMRVRSWLGWIPVGGRVWLSFVSCSVAPQSQICQSAIRNGLKLAIAIPRRPAIQECQSRQYSRLVLLTWTARRRSNTQHLPRQSFPAHPALPSSLSALPLVLLDPHVPLPRVLDTPDRTRQCRQLY